ncbi:MAG: hypothetical protein H6916_09565 [Novosphingobium sp.]|uniref:hypothetical protein n=1 Tax=Novosphingobium sp. TaxID=1874826 RepID=UPI00260EB3EF|nr:hypothetical protein [Novosphingobium sp.]MCP5387041.1 hypothetical protein [Novosphingobium sp.]
MLNKVSSLARALSVLVAVVAGFMPGLGFDAALVIVVLSLVSGISMPTERMTGSGVAALALPVVGGALGHLPAVGEQLNAVAGNLALGVASALGSAIAIYLFNMVKDDLMGLGK